MSVINGSFPLRLIKLLEKSKNYLWNVPSKTNSLSNELSTPKHLLDSFYPKSGFQKN